MIGCTVKSSALPNLASCPICKARDQLLVFVDPTLGGEWSYCRECKFAGDMITLASETWKLGIPSTLRKLSSTEDIATALSDQRAIENYNDFFYKPFRRIKEYWHKCQQNHTVADTSQLRMLQRHFNVLSNADDWAERTGRFIGSSNKVLSDAFLEPKRFANWDTYKHKSTGSFSSKTFRGPKWKDLLVVPYWDLPGRICGFLYIGREGRLEADFLFKSLLRGEAHEAGLAMLPALLEGGHPTFGMTKFIMTDVDIAMRFHARHGRDHFRALPLGATWDDGHYATAEIWKCFHPQNLVFWGTEPLTVIDQARRANGNVSRLVVTRMELDTNLRSYTPTEWLERIRIAAVPWAAALQTYLVKLDDQAIEEALLKIDLCDKELSQFIAGCEPDMQERLKNICANKRYANKVKFEGKWFFQNADGWHLAKGEECITNAAVQIEQVLTTLDGKSYYRGNVKFRGQSYPFTEKCATLDKGMLAWAQNFLRDQCRAGLCEFYPSWNRKSVQLAIKFSDPKYAQGVEVIGWDTVNRQFNFPKFAIRSGGVVTTDFSCLFDNPQVPARELLPPTGLQRRHVDDLSVRNDETQIFWAVTACVAANIVAAAVNRNRLPIVLSGDGAIGVGTTSAMRLGCVPIIDRAVERDGFMPSQLPEHRWNGGWPAVVRIPARASTFAWLDNPQALDCIFSMSDVGSRVIAMRGRTNTVRHTRKLGSMQLLYHAAPYVLPNYLQDLYSRNIFLPDEQADLAADVLMDIAGWFGGLGGSRETVEMALSILHTPSSKTAADYFCELVFQLRQQGVLSYDKAEFSTIGTAASIVELTDKDQLIWVSQDRFSDAVKAECGLAPDLLLINKALTDAGALVSEPSLERAQGWLLRYEWLDQQLSKWRQHNGDGMV